MCILAQMTRAPWDRRVFLNFDPHPAARLGFLVLVPKSLMFWGFPGGALKKRFVPIPPIGTCGSVPQSQRRASSDAAVAATSPPAKKAAAESPVSSPLRVPSMATSRTDQVHSAEELCIAATAGAEPNTASEVTADGNWATAVSDPTEFAVTATSLADARQELRADGGREVHAIRYWPGLAREGQRGSSLQWLHFFSFF
jgi:hypothetical protein